MNSNTPAQKNQLEISPISANLPADTAPDPSIRMVRIQYKWSNPHTSPPDDAPRILFDQVVSEDAWKAGIPELLAIQEATGLGNGYSEHWSLEEESQYKPWPKERKAEQRKRNLRKRLENKAPLFADELYEKEVDRRPEYFKGETPTLIPLTEVKKVGGAQ